MSRVKLSLFGSARSVSSSDQPATGVHVANDAEYRGLTPVEVAAAEAMRHMPKAARA